MTRSNINKKHWIILSIVSVIAVFVWLKFTYPQLAFIDITVSKKAALKIAKNHLRQNYPEYQQYRNTIVFKTDDNTNLFLQRNLGFRPMKAFLKEHNVDLFYWLIRFFKENEREEFLVFISSKTGKIITFTHKIEETAHRPFIEEEPAKETAITFLKNHYSFNPQLHTIKSDQSRTYDNRMEYSFGWEKDSVNIKWSEKSNAGTGKLFSKVRISGNEILSFTSNVFSIPNEFKRELLRKKNIGSGMTTVASIFYYILLVAAVYCLVTRQNHLAMHASKKFYLILALSLLLLSCLEIFNEFQSVLFKFPTTEKFAPYMIRYVANNIVALLIASLSVLIPALAGELIYEEIKNKREQGKSFLYFLRTTFLSRNVALMVILGYIVCFIMLGMQSLLFEFGQKYLSVWIEYTWINRIPSATIPLLAAFTIAVRASLNEEILYRFFAINWGKKIFKNAVIPAVIVSIAWGFGHSSYPVYPMWFRGLEITCLGLFLSWTFLRFGIIPVIVGHFLFDVFWNSAGYLMGKSTAVHKSGSLILLLIPLMFAVIAFLINREEVLKPLRWQLSKHQLFNLKILNAYLENNKERVIGIPDNETRKELIAHNWDVAVIDCALEDFRKNK